MNHDVSDEASRGPRGPVALAVLGFVGLLLFAGFTALGIWQIYRLGWKHDLIARVDQRVHAPAVAVPGADRWSSITVAGDEYRHVRVTGTFLHALQTRVRASTELGSGFWILTPLRTGDGTVVMINRGFATPDWCGGKLTCAPGPEGEVTITGLLRISEPRGAMLQKNDPAREHWYSRDVQAIAETRHLSGVAPFFVDAEASGLPDPRIAPVGGLTVIRFPDNHLVYAITWFALALMVAGGIWYVGREERRLRRTNRRFL
ncbi:surfeit locus 1 family protein [Luteibacter rhizovicinus]|uniref:SURF1-like protein n=1 Tax=Luteibacter rhizovicinus TaxID=242606 RepID=A0A4R3YYA6_9GAMM|nr:SURF1 family protein [Luteibacter rhizovicinus]TCV96474.1 surfeit locus 1 family protein [Luteibacter rhizovicinus]